MSRPLPFTAAKRWAHLNVDQLLGAEYAYRVLRTSPRIKGLALETLDDVLSEVAEEIVNRDRDARAKREAGR